MQYNHLLATTMLLASRIRQVTKFLTVIVIGLTVIGSAVGATPPAGVTVTYALIPKERLGDAVKGKHEALGIEDAWRKEMMSKPGLPPYPVNLANEKFSIVVFIENPPRSMVWGRIGLPIQNPRNPVILNVSLAPGYSGTYVIDGGGRVLPKIPPEPKPSEWLEVHFE
jgi:hypothetical protein